MDNLVTLPTSAFLLSHHVLSLVDLSCHNTGRSRCLYPQRVRYSSKTTGAIQSSRKTSDGRRNLCPASGVGKMRSLGPPQTGRPCTASLGQRPLPGAGCPAREERPGRARRGRWVFRYCPVARTGKGSAASLLSNLRSRPVFPTRQFLPPAGA